MIDPNWKWIYCKVCRRYKYCRRMLNQMGWLCNDCRNPIKKRIK